MHKRFGNKRFGNLMAGVKATALGALVCMAQATACPTLPADAKVVWDSQRGPDFYVCIAQDAATHAQLFGIYLGFAPSFSPEGQDAIGQGLVAQQAVMWYRFSEAETGSAFAKQTVVTLRKEPLSLAHIWIMASSAADAARADQVLARIRFEGVAPAASVTPSSAPAGHP